MTIIILTFVPSTYDKLGKVESVMFCNRNCCRQGFGMNQNMMQPMMENQVVEPTITKCVEQEFYHEVPQDYPLMSYKILFLYLKVNFVSQ